jgi:hypothetical protein
MIRTAHFIRSGILEAGALFAITAATAATVVALNADKASPFVFWLLVAVLGGALTVVAQAWVLPRLPVFVSDREKGDPSRLALPVLLATANSTELLARVREARQTCEEMSLASARLNLLFLPVLDLSTEILAEEIESDPNLFRLRTFDWMSLADRVERFALNLKTAGRSIEQAKTVLGRIDLAIRTPELAVQTWREELITAGDSVHLSGFEMSSAFIAGRVRILDLEFTGEDVEELIRNLSRGYKVFSLLGDDDLAEVSSKLAWRLQRSPRRYRYRHNHSERSPALVLDLRHEGSLLRPLLDSISLLSSLTRRIERLGRDKATLQNLLWTDYVASQALEFESLNEVLPTKAISVDPIADILLSPRIYRGPAKDRRATFMASLGQIDRGRRENLDVASALFKSLSPLAAPRWAYEAHVLSVLSEGGGANAP